MRPRQPQGQLHMRDWIFWKILWQEKSDILQSSKLKLRNQDSLLYTPCTIQQPSLSTKPSVISLLKMHSFGLCLSHFVYPTKNEFQNKKFYQDHRVNQKSFTWNKFRLSLPIMNSTLNHCTHFRATCNFNTDGLVTTHYLRGKPTDLNIQLLYSEPCVKLELINIRVYDCYGCTVKMT